MAREVLLDPSTTTTPTRRAVSAEPSTGPRRLSIRTPGSNAASRRLQIQQQQGLSASGRRGAGQATTPHARAAFRTLDSRRAAIFTPHRDRISRRRASGARPERETPRDFLRGLSRVLAPTTQAIASSSSPGSGTKGNVPEAGQDDDEDWDDDLPIDRPRLSLPIDDFDDDGDLRPHRSAGLEELVDEANFTMQSIEFPRRALSEQPPGRSSMESAGLREYFENVERGDESVGIDSGFFPPTEMIEEEDDEQDREDMTYERLDEDAEPGRQDTVRGGDFAFDGLGDGNDSTVMIAPQIQSSPTRADQTAIEGPEIMDQEPVQDDDEDLDDDDEVPLDGADGTVAMEVDLGKNLAASAEKAAANRAKKKRGVQLSKHGIAYPSLPQGVVKRVAQTLAKTSGINSKITPDTLDAIMTASDWYFQQLGDDLQAYAKHAGRKTINESDMLTLMRRQRKTGSSATPFSLAQRYLPRELLQDLRMPPPAKVSTKGRK